MGDPIIDLDKRLTAVEERLLGGAESFAEIRKELRELRRVTTDLREVSIVLAGRDGTGGTVAAMQEGIKTLGQVRPEVEKLGRVYWKLSFLALGAGTVAGTIAQYFL